MSGRGGIDVVVQAGGLGTRLQEVLPDLPKCLAPVLGRPLVDYILEHWASSTPVRRWIISVRHRAQPIRDHFVAPTCLGAEVVFDTSTGGTAVNVKRAIALCAIERPFIVLNADTYLDASFDALHGLHEHRAAAATLALVRVPYDGGFSGIALDAEARVLPEPQALDGLPATVLTYGGTALIDPVAAARCLADLPPDSETTFEEACIVPLINQGRLYGVETGAHFLDIGVPDRYAQAPQLFAEWGLAQGSGRA